MTTPQPQGSTPTTPLLSLTNLPEDLLLKVLEHLDTARDFARLSLLDRKWRSFIEREGWRIFVKTCFSTLEIPADKVTSWKHLANVLTHQDRCWDRRAFMATLFTYNTRFRRQGPHAARQQSAPFQSILKAHQTPCLEKEVVVIGAGENLTACFRPAWMDLHYLWDRAGVTENWINVYGEHAGYAPGMGDITALSFAQLGSRLRLATGRANGSIDVLSASEDDFGKKLATLSPPQNPTLAMHDRSAAAAQVSSLAAISSLDWQTRRHLLVAGTRTAIGLYSLSQDIEKDIIAENAEPFSSHDLNMSGSSSPPFKFLRSAKFINRSTIACAFAGSRAPLRWVQLTESGFAEMHPARDLAQISTGAADPTTTVRAIEPVGVLSAASGDENLLLSAWDDGSVRLWDVRTPSSFDMSYQDKFDDHRISSLLIYGSERFVCGVNSLPAIKIFDFRWPKPYHHTTALPCTKDRLYPMPPESPPLVMPVGKLVAPQCNAAKGQRCIWHHWCKTDYYRPDCAIHSRTAPSARGGPVPVYSLAKASDLSQTFFAGLAGAFLEFDLHVSPRDPIARPYRGSFGNWNYTPDTLAVLETAGQSSSMPPMRIQRYPVASDTPPAVTRLHHRICRDDGRDEMPVCRDFKQTPLLA
jgi:hypothetical protein